LIADPRQPNELIVTATCRDANVDVVMAVEHSLRPWFGVQFHPESVCTEFGQQLVRNFRDIARRFQLKKSNAMNFLSWSLLPAFESPTSVDSKLQLLCREMKPAQKWTADHLNVIFKHLYAGGSNFVFLDSARRHASFAKFSILGRLSAADDSRSFSVQYRLTGREIRVDTRGLLEAINLSEDEMFIDWLKRKVKPFETDRIMMDGQSALPFDFRCGLVGYLGYEMAQECDLFHDHSQLIDENMPYQQPDAAFVFLDRALVFDHETLSLYVMCLVDPGDATDMKHATRWIQRTSENILNLPHSATFSSPPCQTSVSAAKTIERDRYEHAINQAQQHILDGDSYELCLTTRWQYEYQGESLPSPSALFETVRQNNPAPFGAYFLFTDLFERYTDVAIISSSPERFMSVTPTGHVSMKPIKGTRPRHPDPNEDLHHITDLGNSVKDRAENLMIVDLVRNDLTQICDPISVRVPQLMVIESYQTVHQLVSEVQGQLPRGQHALDVLKYSFPPGSMTGAPKKRSVELLQDIESRLGQRYRGVYSGCLGYISLNGASDLSVVIRTLFGQLRRDSNDCIIRAEWSIGAGGAITALSNVAEEYDEMVLKANSVLPSLQAVYGHPIN
jgi:para-aminobenzoate synthetase